MLMKLLHLLLKKKQKKNQLNNIHVEKFLIQRQDNWFCLFYFAHNYDTTTYSNRKSNSHPDACRWKCFLRKSFW